VQIAEALGCDYVLNCKDLSVVPRNKSVFICVKPNIAELHLQQLSMRGIVIWDIHDSPPPARYIYAYIAGSPQACREFRAVGNIHLIPHHHCNFSGVPNPPNMTRRPGWVGRPYWCPDLGNLDYDFYNSNIMSHREVVAAYRKIGISLNVRAPKEDAVFHARINPGVKLLNAVGFGIPSISTSEPAYKYYAPDCTVFAEPHECLEWVARLQKDGDLYMQLYSCAVKRASAFHITQVANLYLDLLKCLAL